MNRSLPSTELFPCGRRKQLERLTGRPRSLPPGTSGSDSASPGRFAGPPFLLSSPSPQTFPSTPESPSLCHPLWEGHQRARKQRPPTHLGAAFSSVRFFVPPTWTLIGRILQELLVTRVNAAAMPDLGKEGGDSIFLSLFFKRHSCALVGFPAG